MASKKPATAPTHGTGPRKSINILAMTTAAATSPIARGHVGANAGSGGADSW